MFGEKIGGEKEKVKILVVGLAMTAMMMMAISTTSAVVDYKIDGNLSEWGVIPFVDWVPDSETAAYITEDYNGTNPSERPLGGEAYDIEAMYFDSNGTDAFFAVVTSFRYTGDLGIDLNNDGVCEYGIVTRPLRPNYGTVYKDPIWSKPTHPGEASGIIKDGTVVGIAELKQVQIDSDPGWKPNIPNHIIEISVKRSVLGNPTEGQLSKILLTMWCGNDEIVLGLKWTEEIPEFSTIVIPITATIGLFYFFRSKRRKSENN